MIGNLKHLLKEDPLAINFHGKKRKENQLSQVIRLRDESFRIIIVSKNVSIWHHLEQNFFCKIELLHDLFLVICAVHFHSALFLFCSNCEFFAMKYKILNVNYSKIKIPFHFFSYYDSFMHVISFNKFFLISVIHFCSNSFFSFF